MTATPPPVTPTSPGLVLSLFPGIGLLDMAFEAEGFAVVAGPDVCWGRDIRVFHVPAGRFDGIIGGPPCQPFSPLVHLIRANGHEPKHGNMIPEYERLVAEAQPEWFVMEEVPQAPLPVVAGYSVSSFVLDNASLCDGAGLGLPQMRKRRWSFGLRGELAVDLRRWIQQAALELPDVGSAVCRDAREVPVAVGGSGKVKARVVTADYDSGVAPGNHRKRTWEECCALQGLPPDFLSESPFTKSGKYTVLGNGVPLPMGRAIARAVKAATA